MRCTRRILFVASTLYAMPALAQVAIPEADPAASLRDRYAALSGQLEQSSIQQGPCGNDLHAPETSRLTVLCLAG